MPLDGTLNHGNGFGDHMVVLAGRGPGRRPCSIGPVESDCESGAVVAVAHSLLTVIYQLSKAPTLQDPELGDRRFETIDPQRLCRHPVRDLQSLGCEVPLAPRAA